MQPTQPSPDPNNPDTNQPDNSFPSPPPYEEPAIPKEPAIIADDTSAPAEPAQVAPSSMQPVQDVTPASGASPQPAVFSPTVITPNQESNTEPPASVTSSFGQPQQPAQNSVAPGSLSGLANPVSQSQPAPVPMANTNPGGNSKGGKRKKLLISLVVVVVLLLGAAGFVFGYYLPNLPENVWKTGLNRTADEMDGFIEKISDPATIESLAKNKLTIKGSMDAGGTDMSLNMDSVFDDKSSDSTMSFEASGENSSQDMKIDASLKTQSVEGSLWPNVYFKLSGISSLGLDLFLPGASDFDDKWIAVEQDFYEEFLSGVPAGEEDNEITQEDAISILTDVSAVTREYVFTTDETKAVLDMQEFVGTEDSEGIKANRYKVKINEANSKAYCEALIEKLFANESFRSIEGVTDENREEKLNSEKEACDISEDESAADAFHETFDVWIDKKYKLFHKVRVTEDLEKQAERYKEDKAECLEDYARFDFEGASSFCDYYDDFIETGESYTEFGQTYKGKDEIQLFVHGKNDTNLNKDSIRADINVQFDGLLFNGKVSYKNESEDNKSFAEITIATEPYDGEIDASRPEDATSLMEAYEYIQTKAQSQYEYNFGQSLGASTENDLEQPHEPSSPGILDALQQFFR